jgi:hypothetical protein
MMMATAATMDPRPNEVEAAAHWLYEADLALHDALQTHEDQWIKAAYDHLHLAAVRYAEAVAAKPDR